jgi:hypothetical protein
MADDDRRGETMEDDERRWRAATDPTAPSPFRTITDQSATENLPPPRTQTITDFIGVVLLAAGTRPTRTVGDGL